MTPEAVANILGGLTEALVGAFFGFIITYFAFSLQRKRKVIEYEVFSMPLLRFKPTADRILSVSIEKFILTGEEADRGLSVQIDNAYGFEIALMNSGNEPIVKPNIEIRLDKSAKIVEYETQPISRPGYEITVQNDSSELNVLRVSVPFINRHERILIRVISTGNASRECQVDVLGLGIRARARRPIRTLVYLFGGYFVLTGVVAASAFAHRWLPIPIITFLGARIETEMITSVVLPWWLNTIVLIGAFLFMLVFSIAVSRMIIARNRWLRRGWD